MTADVTRAGRRQGRTQYTRPAALRDRLRHEPQGRGRLPRPLLQALRPRARCGACSTSPAAPGPTSLRLADRGYAMAGLDLSREEHRLPARAAGARKGQRAELVVGDMTDFRLPQPVDAAICMQDSQGHLLTNEQLLAHLRAVAARCAAAASTSSTATWRRRGPNPARSWSWSARRGPAHRAGVVLGAERRQPGDPGVPERMTLEAVENGTRRVYRQTHISRMVFPQELRALVDAGRAASSSSSGSSASSRTRCWSARGTRC